MPFFFFGRQNFAVHVINRHIACKVYEQLQVTSQGQFSLLGYSDVKKAKGNDLAMRL